MPPTMEVWSRNPWTTREVPRMALLIIVEVGDLMCLCVGGRVCVNYIILLSYMFGIFHSKKIKYFSLAHLRQA